MKTIPKNHKKKIAEIQAKMTACVVFGNDRKVCAPRVAWERLYMFDFAKLWEREPGSRYTVYVHSNLSYDLTVSPHTPPYYAESCTRANREDVTRHGEELGSLDAAEAYINGLVHASIGAAGRPDLHRVEIRASDGETVMLWSCGSGVEYI